MEPVAKWTLVARAEMIRRIRSEAARQDRSASTLVRIALTLQLEDLRRLAIDSEAVRLLRDRVGLREPVRLFVLHGGSVPTGCETQPLFIPESLAAQVELEADRLKLATWEIIVWCWDRSEAHLKSMDPAPPDDDQ